MGPERSSHDTSHGQVEESGWQLSVYVMSVYWQWRHREQNKGTCQLRSYFCLLCCYPSTFLTEFHLRTFLKFLWVRDLWLALLLCSLFWCKQSNLFDESVSDWTMCLHTDIPTWWHNSSYHRPWRHISKEERCYCCNKQRKKKKRRQQDKVLLKERSDQRLYLIMIITVSHKGLLQPSVLVCGQVPSGTNTMHTVWLRWGTHADLIAHKHILAIRAGI